VSDKDGDGVPDAKDNCPEVTGSAEQQGCPEAQKVAITDDRIEIKETVLFKTASGTVRDVSYGLLEQVANVLKAHPEIGKVRVDGHTDDRGDAAKNKELSLRRAKAVVKFLVEKGVPAERLTAEGHGEEAPLAGNESEAGREKNRRVEFVIQR
jgi:outer membrane protein OmpA-like peptidoglycan-associated protein